MGTLDAFLGAVLGVSVASTPPVSGGGDTFLFTLDNGKTNAFYRIESVDGNLRGVRYRESYAQPKVLFETPNVSSVVYSSRMDCSAKTMQTMQAAAYRDTDALSEPVTRKTQPLPPKPINFAKDEVGTRLYKLACAATEPHRKSETETAQNTDSTSKEPRTVAEGGGSDSAEVARPSGVVATTDGDLVGDGFPPAHPISEAGPFSSHYPFTDSKITLGVLGLLSEYVYFNQEQLAFKAAILAKFRRAYGATVLERGPMRVTLNDSLERLTGDFNDYQAKMNEKAALLARHGLTRLELPVTERPAWDPFYAELYREDSSGELILVFRGTTGALDWLSNIWLGLDLFKLEAPHYAAARELADSVVRTGKKPIVTGHSLGGGLAQYAATKFGLRAVAFNSSPLPARYFASRREIDPSKIRVYSAIEKKTSRSGEEAYHPDPVSITAPRAFERINAALSNEYVKSHFHLVKPTCVESAPDPFVLPQEEKRYWDKIDETILTGVFSGAFDGKSAEMADSAVKLKIKFEVDKFLRGPAWLPDSRSKEDLEIYNAIAKEVQGSAVATYKELGGTIKVVKSMGELLAGRYVSGAKPWGRVFGEMAKTSAAQTYIFYPHSMNRFNRGMRAQVDANPFVAEAILVQCAMPSSKY